MTSADETNDLMPAQEKLEWVTPKISLIDDIRDTEAGKNPLKVERSAGATIGGPS